MQRLGGGDRPLVVIDYAHTPDALDKVLDGAASGGRRRQRAHLRVRLRRRARSRQAARNGPACGAGSPIACWSPATTRAAKTRRRSPATSCTAFATPATGAIRSSSIARSPSPRAIGEAGARRCRAARRQGPRNLPGVQRRAACRSATPSTRRARSTAWSSADDGCSDGGAGDIGAARRRQCLVRRRQHRFARRAPGRALRRAQRRALRRPRIRRAGVRARRRRGDRRRPIARRGSQQSAAGGGRSLLAVADPLQALASLAAFWRRRFTLPVVAVVGSNGKTTVKEMTAAILRAACGADRVLATAGNLNNQIGLPLMVLRLRAMHSVAVFEIGMNHVGETAQSRRDCAADDRGDQQRAARAPGVHAKRRRRRGRARGRSSARCSREASRSSMPTTTTPRSGTR